LPRSDIYYDWQVLGAGSVTPPLAEVVTKHIPSDEPSDAEPVVPESVPLASTRVLIGAAPKILADAYTTTLEQAGLAPIGLEIEATAIARALLPLSDIGAPVGILDIGATRSSLIVYDNGVIQMSISIPVSGISITEAISESLQVPFSDAETLK